MTITCDYCDCTAPDGAIRIDPRVPDRTNVPAVHTHVANYAVNSDFVYAAHGCDYCDSPWASLKVINLDLMLHQYSVMNGAKAQYDIGLYGVLKGDPKGNDAVKQMVADTMSNHDTFGTLTVNVCGSCDPSASADVPALGVNCVSPSVVSDLNAKAFSMGQADRVKSQKSKGI